MSKTLTVEFHSVEAGPGVVDMAIRFDTKTGRYNFMIEENGLPTGLPMHVFNGILTNLIQEACRGSIEGYRAE